MYCLKHQDYLMHIGVKYRSGRYEYGSGEEPYQHDPGLRGRIKSLRDNGMTEKEIAASLGMKVSQMKAEVSLEKDAQRQADYAFALRLKEKGYSVSEIGRRMGKNESSIRSLLEPARIDKMNITKSTADMLKRQVEEKPYLDIGAGTEISLGVSRDKLKVAVEMLKKEGYKTHYFKQEQVGTGNETNMLVLTKGTVSFSELLKNKDKIRAVTDWSEDGGRTYVGLKPVKSVDSSRVMVKYAEDGGADRDGMIQIRRGLKDASIGDNGYAQVRIAVDDKYYMKGMAVYADNLPDGIDFVYNSNKNRKESDPMVAFKKMEIDPKTGEVDQRNPFGTTIRQKGYVDENGKEELSPVNFVGYSQKIEAGEEGSWDTWNRSLASQFLAKQPLNLVKTQLDLTVDIQKSQFDDIMNVTNPAVKQRLLDSFADDCDSKAVDLAATALPRQGTKVILSFPSLKEDEAYLPQYANGEKVALIRYPHAGTFEIPVVTVNNKNKEARDTIPQAIDAIGIHPKTAAQLSGADFDGDTVIAIPYTKDLKVSKPLQELQGFEPKAAYPYYKGMKVMGYPKGVDPDDPKAPPLDKREKGVEMGKITNLITDMTIQGASPNEIARAVRHSMVVIDSEKHRLNYQQSYIDNGIADLKKTYQGGANRGAATLLSRATSEQWVDKRRPLKSGDPGYENVVRRGKYSVDKETGQKVYVRQDPKRWTNKEGENVEVYKKERSTRMYEIDDAFKLSSGTKVEDLYANYANSMKRMGDAARKASIEQPSQKYSPSARQAYMNEVKSLEAKLRIAKSNAPLERQAQLLADSLIKMQIADNPELGTARDKLKKIKGMELEKARIITGASKKRVQLTEKEWEAIQAGAISHSKLLDLLSNSNIEEIQKLATPRQPKGIPEAKIARVKSMLSRGYTQAEIASHLGVSVSTVNDLAK